MSFLRTSLGTALFAVLAAGLPAAGLQPGDALPPLQEYQLDGDIPPLAGKVVLLDVWASWCAPCKASFPHFAELQREFGADGFVVLAVSVDRKAADYTRFLKRMKPDFATVRDGSQQLVAQLSPPAMPTSFLFGRDGALRSVHAGFHGERTATDLETEIRDLLKEASR